MQSEVRRYSAWMGVAMLGEAVQCAAKPVGAALGTAMQGKAAFLESISRKIN